jgi:hypothetical protein
MGIDMSISCVECAEGTDSDSNHSEIPHEEILTKPKSPPPPYSLHNPQKKQTSPTQPTLHPSLAPKQQLQPSNLIQQPLPDPINETDRRKEDQEGTEISLPTKIKSSSLPSVSPSQEKAVEPTKLLNTSAPEEIVPYGSPAPTDQRDPQSTQRKEESARISSNNMHTLSSNEVNDLPMVIEEIDEKTLSAQAANENRSPESWGDFQSVELSDSETSPGRDPSEDAASPPVSLSRDAKEVGLEVIAEIGSVPGLSEKISSPQPPRISLEAELEAAGESPTELSELDDASNSLHQPSPEDNALQNPPEALHHTLSSLSQDSSNDSIAPLPLSPMKPIFQSNFDDISVSSHHSSFSHRSISSATSHSSSKRMVTCDRCHQTLPRHSFSSIQLKKKIHRICKQCLNGDVYVL